MIKQWWHRIRREYHLVKSKNTLVLIIAWMLPGPTNKEQLDLADDLVNCIMSHPQIILSMIADIPEYTLEQMGIMDKVKKLKHILEEVIKDGLENPNRK